MEIPYADDWEKAFAIFQEMELHGVQPDSIACSTLMRAFNRGCQPGKVLLAADFMKEKKIPLSDAIFSEIISACTMLVFHFLSMFFMLQC